MNGVRGEIVPGGVRINPARGLKSLVSQVAARVNGGGSQLGKACVEILHAAIDETVPSQEISALDAARQLGILQKKRKRA
jgi:hypothetical protein